MIESYLRPIYQKTLVDPVIELFSYMTFVSANVVTVLGLLVGLFAAYMIPVHPAFAVVLLLLSGYCDTLDGSLSRVRHTSSDTGAVLDVLFDRVVEIAIMFALLWSAPEERMWPIFAMLCTTFLCVTSFLLVGIFAKSSSQKSFYYSVGIMERPEAFIFFIAMILLPSYFEMLAWAYSILVLLTAVLRVSIFFIHDRKNRQNT